MFRRTIAVSVLSVLVLVAAACSNKRVQNPIADLDSKQPDKVLFDRAMEALKRNKFDVARLTLQTLINTYPDSEYVARAKLAVGDAWYAEHTSAALAQAEIEYKDFITFFPNMPEAAEAQLKVARIHYEQMEKPDRDFTHARRAEEELRILLQDFPDSPHVDDAKSMLLEVQEVLAEREFRIGRFYYLRYSFPAAIARLKSVADKYPLYSQADEALYLLGSSYEKQMEMIYKGMPDSPERQRLLRSFADKAAEAYARIATRYPVMERAEEARQRLLALERDVPEPTPEAIAQNRAEEESRGELGRWGKVWLNFRRRPDTSTAAKVGQPTLVDPEPTNAPDIVRSTARAIMEAQQSAGGGNGSADISVETVGGAPRPNDPTPRASDAPPPAPPATNQVGQDPEAESSTPNGSDDEYSSSNKKKKKKKKD